MPSTNYDAQDIQGSFYGKRHVLGERKYHFPQENKRLSSLHEKDAQIAQDKESRSQSFTGYGAAFL